MVGDLLAVLLGVVLIVGGLAASWLWLKKALHMWRLRSRGVTVQTTPVRDRQGWIARRTQRKQGAEATYTARFVKVSWHDLRGFQRQREWEVPRRWFNHPEQIALLLDPEEPEFAELDLWGARSPVPHLFAVLFCCAVAAMGVLILIARLTDGI